MKGSYNAAQSRAGGGRELNRHRKGAANNRNRRITAAGELELQFITSRQLEVGRWEMKFPMLQDTSPDLLHDTK